MAGNAFCIRTAVAADGPAWDKFVLEHKGSSFFHRFGWRDVLTNTYGHKPYYLLAEQAGDIVGVLPLFMINSPFFGRSFVSTAFTVGGGVLGADAAVRAGLSAEAIQLGTAGQVNYVELRGGDDLPGWQTKQDVYAGFRKTLALEESDNLLSVPRKKRADLRKAIKAAGEGQLKFLQEPDVSRFYDLYAQSVARHGTPVFPRKLVTQILAAFGDDVEISFVEAQGKTAGTLLSFFHQGTIMPYYNGAAPVARNLHAVDYLYWRQMRHGVEVRQATTFDFGRSKFGTGPFSYKTYWGFSPMPLRYHYWLIKATMVPDINPNNPKFSLITKVWQQLPLAVTNRLGPLLARNLA